MARYAKSSSGRVIWTVTDEGRLHEVSNDSFSFVMLAVDTKTLKDLLVSESDAIDAAAEKELFGYAKGGSEAGKQLAEKKGVQQEKETSDAT